MIFPPNSRNGCVIVLHSSLEKGKRVVDVGSMFYLIIFGLEKVFI